MLKIKFEERLSSKSILQKGSFHPKIVNFFIDKNIHIFKRNIYMGIQIGQRRPHKRRGKETKNRAVSLKIPAIFDP